MRKLLRRLVRAVALIVATIILIPVLGLAYGYVTSGAPVGGPLQPVALTDEQKAISTSLDKEIDGYRRPEESTYLTYPEWAIVYAAREYAGLVREQPPHAFPCWAYIGRYWADYAAMIRASSRYRLNLQNHLMLVVIGISHTVEHAIQWLYENTAGRITYAVAGGTVEQDGFLAENAAEYADFLDQVPWYAYPYETTQDALWDIPVAGGQAAIRSWERRLGFSAALKIKQAYADLIKSGLAATSDPAALDIHVWAKGPVAQAIAGEPDTRIERDLGPQGAVFVTRRYQVFTDMVPRLIRRGITFVEIGGNDEILVTITSTRPLNAPGHSRLLFSYALPVDPAQRRTGFAISVRRLHEALQALDAAGARLEHIYDY